MVNNSRRAKMEVAMRKIWFLGGLAAGFVLGARAGREKYEEMMSTARKIKEHPTVQEATGVVQEQANRLYSTGKDRVGSSRLGQTRMGGMLSGSGSSTTQPVGTGSTSGSTSTMTSTTASDYESSINGGKLP